MTKILTELVNSYTQVQNTVIGIQSQYMVAICEGVIKNSKTIDAKNQVASATWAPLKTPMTKSDVHLISAYHRHFLFSHFAWLQKGDPNIGNQAGLLSAHIGSRYFLMHQDLEQAMDNGWKTLSVFDKFKQSLELITNIAQQLIEETKCNLFLTTTKKSLQKHFDLWVNQNLFLSLFSEGQVGSVVAKFLSDGDDGQPVYEYLH